MVIIGVFIAIWLVMLFARGESQWSITKAFLQMNEAQRKEVGKTYRSPVMIAFIILVFVGFLAFRYYPPLQSREHTFVEVIFCVLALVGFMLIKSRQIKRFEQANLPSEFVQKQKRAFGFSKAFNIFLLVLLASIAGLAAYFRFLSH